MKRIPAVSLFVLMFLCACGEACADLFAPENRVDPSNPPAELTAIGNEIRASGPVRAPFVETRKFPFRKTPTVLSGVNVLMPGECLLTRYDSPEERETLVVGSSIFEISPEKAPQRLPVPEQYEKLLAIHNMDLASLAEAFDLFFESGTDGWRLGLERTRSVRRVAGQTSVDATDMRITVNGAGKEMRSMRIQRGSSLDILIEMSPPKTPDSDEVLRIEKLASECAK